jgi:hypothetical protein
MTLIIQKPTGAKLVMRKGWQPMDADAAAYITAVETADAQALEERTKIAIDNFVLGCKADGIWTAIKASCILAGARTLTGALVPLVGTAPTNVGFIGIGTDYVRKTGLVGNGSSKAIDANRNRQADPQDNAHVSVYISQATSLNDVYYYGAFVGGAGGTGLTYESLSLSTVGWLGSSNLRTFAGLRDISGFAGATRSTASQFTSRAQKQSVTHANTSQAPVNTKLVFFATNQNTSGTFAAVAHSNARIAFYSIGESLDLQKLDARVTDLINAFAAAIP